MGGYTFVRLFGNLLSAVEKPQALEGKVWLYVVSQNNYDSLKFIAEGLPDSVFVAGQSKALGKYRYAVQRISLRQKIIFYYKLLPLSLQFLKHNRKSTLRFFDLLYDAIGFYEVYLEKIRKYKPKAIIFANDHNADARAMLLAAKANGIKTVYIQHASVSALFPPLSFDLNLLEGQDALDKYCSCGPISGEVKLIGLPKADAFVFKRNQSNTIRTIGIGCNLLDDLTEIKNLVKSLSLALPDIKFILRPHPRDKRNFQAMVAMSPNITLSDSHHELTFDYLQQLDVQISGNSGIHLEAVLLNVWSIFYDFNPSQRLDDYYGFIKHGLVDTSDSTVHLLSLLKLNLTSKPNVVGRAAYYNSTIDTPYDGNSKTLALNCINSFLRS
ncbi:glycosyltransferase family protein [Pontibacter oryzae]|nr:hypothetical protein [Pontibacter oryzae]